jgi:DNA ligase-associated metallophosphoesterase
MTTLTFEGVTLELLPEKAVYLPAIKALLVSDVHLGKPETFQRHGIPIATQVNIATLARLQHACDRTQAEHLIVLGDLFHARIGLVDEVIDFWLKFLAQTGLEVSLIVGNHDRPLTATLAQLSLTCWTQPMHLHNLILSHEPLPTTSGALNICGHIHPWVRLGQGRDRLRLPCFYWEKYPPRLTLPAFGDFTGGHEVPVGANAIAYVIAEDQVIAFP